MALAGKPAKLYSVSTILTQIPVSQERALNDNETQAPVSGNHLLISAYSTYPHSPLLMVSRRISESGCNLLDTRLSTVGRDVSLRRKHCIAQALALLGVERAVGKHDASTGFR